jgi:translocation and assembly module TamB
MPRNPFRLTEGVAAHRLSASRLFALVLAFVALSGYAIWKSDRFQNLFLGVSQARLSAALKRPVSFRTADFRIFPPSVRLQDVVIGNDPRAGGVPLLAAEEVSVGGGISLVGQELRLGRIRAVHPRIALLQFPDGTWNLPPFSGPASQGGIKVHLNDILVQEGVLDLAGRKIGLDGRLEDFAVELNSAGPNVMTGRVRARRGTFHLPNAEPLVFALSTRVTLDTKRGLDLDEIVVTGDFGQLRGTGAIEDFARSHFSFDVRGDFSVEEVERVFRSRLGFAGRADVRAKIEILPTGRFRVAGTVAASKIDAHGFPLEDIGATVAAEPQELVATIDRASYQGGRAKGAFRIGNLVAKPQVFTLAVESDGVSLERFFGNLGLSGTGLSGSVALEVALKWGEGGIEKANGGGALQIRPGEAVSIVSGRFGLPVGGGGPLSVVAGRIGFEEITVRLPQTTLDMTGGIRIGQWQPDFDVRSRSRDLAELDRIFQNFVAATGGKAEALGVGGTGEAWGHVGGRWEDPVASLQVTAESARWGGITFGSVRGTVGIEKGAFEFQPLRVYDGDATFALEGTVRYRPEAGKPRFDLVATASEYPLSRFLQYLDLGFPVDGRVTGSFPVLGTGQEITGGGPVTVRNAVVFGQKVSTIASKVVFTPGRFALDDIRGSIGTGVVGGSGALQIREKTFEARLAGDGIPLSAIDALAGSAKDVSGKLSFQLTGHGPIDRPSLKLSAALAGSSFFGHPLADWDEPRLEAEVREGVLEGSVAAPGHWSATVRGGLFGQRSPLTVGVDADDLRGLVALTPLTLAPSIGGAFAASGNVTLPEREGETLSARLTVSKLRLDLPERPGVVSVASPVVLVFEKGRLSVAPFELKGEGTTLTVAGAYDTAGKGSADLTAKGTLDARGLDLVVPELSLSGLLTVDLKATGPAERLALLGSVRIEDGRYRIPGLSQIADEIQGVVYLQGSRAEIDGLRAKIGGGELYAAGGLTLDGGAPSEMRLTIQGRRVSFRYTQDLRLTADADLVLVTGPSGNQILGEITLLRGVYSKDFELTLTDLLERRPAAALAAREAWKEKTSLEVRIVSSSGLEVQNNVARLAAGIDLVARGSLAEPSLVGQVTLVEGGRVTFRNVRYEIETGTILFSGGRNFAPVVDLRARAPLRGYDILVSIAGTWPRLQTSFSSDPPLADDVVLGMLLSGTPTGAAPAGQTTIVSAAGGVVADVLTAPLSKGTQKLFRLDRFGIEPVFSGNQVDVRSTVGKQITPNVLVTYSQSLDTAKQPIINLEWRLSDTITLRALRDENGIFVLDVRRRLRL